MNDSQQDLVDLLEQESVASERNPDAPMRPGTVVSRRGRASRIYSIRLSENEIDALESAATRTGVPASTLARSWIVERLAEDELTDVQAIADALATFSRRLAAL